MDYVHDMCVGVVCPMTAFLESLNFAKEKNVIINMKKN